MASSSVTTTNTNDDHRVMLQEQHKIFVRNCIFRIGVGDSTKYKCNCCFAVIASQPDIDAHREKVLIIRHCEEPTHLERACKTDALLNNRDLITDQDCSLIFENCLAISFADLSIKSKQGGHPKLFNSFCFSCCKLLKHGMDIIKTHVSSKDHINSFKRKQLTDKCSVCDVCYNDAFSHKKGKFHLAMCDEQKFFAAFDGQQQHIPYDDDDDDDENEITALEPVPSSFCNVKHYASVMLDLVKSDQMCHKRHAKSLIMKDLTVRWGEKVRGGIKPIKVYFHPTVSDENYFKIKIGDKLIIVMTSINNNFERTGFVIRDKQQQQQELQQLLQRDDRVSSQDLRLAERDNDNHEQDFSFYCPFDEICVELSDNGGAKTQVTYPYNVRPKWDSTVLWRSKSTITLFIQTRQYFSFLLPALMNNHSNHHVSNYDDNEDEQDDENNRPRIKTFDLDLNNSQERAIRLAIKSPLLLIHGPPGTGKTATVVAIVRNLLLLDDTTKVLVCAQSNVAVDLLASKLDRAGVDLIRLFSKRHEFEDTPLNRLGLMQRILKNDDKLCKDHEKFLSPTGGMSDEEKVLHKNAITDAIDLIFSRTRVVCTTCITAGCDNFDEIYDVVIIDEAAQATEIECLVPVVRHRAKKLILVGDHRQLGPHVMCNRAKQAGYDRSLFQRFAEQEEIRRSNNLEKIVDVIMLDTQYRMHPTISNFSSVTFYNGQIVNGVVASDRELDINFPEVLGKRSPIVFVNVESSEQPAGLSYSNVAEAHEILRILLFISRSGKLSMSNVGVITPYEGQRMTILRLIADAAKSSSSSSSHSSQHSRHLLQVQVYNIDGFQGREKDIILLSCVRSNDDSSVGFTCDHRRMNVALTRAKRKLIVVGNRDTLIKNPLWREVIDYCDKASV